MAKFKVEITGTAYHSGEGHARVYNEQGQLVYTHDYGVNNGWCGSDVSDVYTFEAEAERPEDIRFFWPF